MIAEIMETKRIVANFDKIISKSPFKTEYISEKSNIALPTLYRKIRDNKFTIDEVLTILEIIEPEQFQYEIVMQNITIAENQIKNGQFIEEKDFVFDVDAILARRK